MSKINQQIMSGNDSTQCRHQPDNRCPINKSNQNCCHQPPNRSAGAGVVGVEAVACGGVAAAPSSSVLSGVVSGVVSPGGTSATDIFVCPSQRANLYISCHNHHSADSGDCFFNFNKSVSPPTAETMSSCHHVPATQITEINDYDITNATNITDTINTSTTTTNATNYPTRGEKKQELYRLPRTEELEATQLDGLNSRVSYNLKGVSYNNKIKLFYNVRRRKNGRLHLIYQPTIVQNIKDPLIVITLKNWTPVEKKIFILCTVYDDDTEIYKKTIPIQKKTNTTNKCCTVVIPTFHRHNYTQLNTNNNITKTQLLSAPPTTTMTKTNLTPFYSMTVSLKIETCNLQGGEAVYIMW